MFQAQPTAEPTAAGTCYLGDWRITGVPAAIGGAVDTTGYVFSLADDGTFYRGLCAVHRVE
ncbi:MAG: hypothetical protein IPK17_19785 [Chloroflexi bacterium]|uniref:hypothetical protein n=1 Tax=Candidatus Flexifilum breve TaxID=3140694 RepID=UPI003135890C|nr:hypothetical protein [Chloroflexota bacterium]